MTKLKHNICDRTRKLEWYKTKINKIVSVLNNLNWDRTLNCDTHKNENCDKTKKLKLWQNYKTQIVTKLKLWPNSNSDKKSNFLTKLKLLQNSKCNKKTNCDKTQMVTQLKCGKCIAKNSSTTQQPDEINSLQPFAILRWFLKLHGDLIIDD